MKKTLTLYEQRGDSTSVDRFLRICANNGMSRDAYTILPGFFDQTLASLSASDEPINVALAYIDCDLYSSTKTVLEFLQPRLKHRVIIAFDAYFCWSDSQSSGERVAMLEFLSAQAQWDFLPYKPFGWHGSHLSLSVLVIRRWNSFMKPFQYGWPL